MASPRLQPVPDVEALSRRLGQVQAMDWLEPEAPVVADGLTPEDQRRSAAHAAYLRFRLLRHDPARLDDAVAALQVAIDNAPQSELLINCYLVFCLPEREGDGNVALVADLESLAARHPDALYLCLLVARSQMRIGQEVAARKLLEAARVHAGWESDLALRMEASACWMTGDLIAGMALLEAATEPGRWRGQFETERFTASLYHETAWQPELQLPLAMRRELQRLAVRHALRAAAASVLPREEAAVIRLAGQLAEMHAAPEAVAMLDRYHLQNGPNRDTRRALADALVAAGRPKAAIAEWQTILRLYPSEDLHPCPLPSLLWGQGQRHTAVLACDELLERRPRASVRYTQVQYLLHLRRGADALEAARHMPATLVTRYYAEGSALVLMGRHEEALGRLEVGREVAKSRNKPETINARYEMLQGRALEALGRDVEARRALEAAVRLEPDEPAALNNLAWFLARRGIELPYARGLAMRALAQKPRNAYYLDTLAWIEYRAGDLRAASNLIERALKYAGPDASPALQAHAKEIRAAATAAPRRH